MSAVASYRSRTPRRKSDPASSRLNGRIAESGVESDRPDPLFRPERLPDPSPPWSQGILGWRYYTYIDPTTGDKVLGQVGLTPEDLLHPQEGDHPTQEPFHAWNLSNLIVILAACLSRIPGARIFSDDGTDWQVPGFPHLHSPDFLIVLNFFGEPRRGLLRVRDADVRPAVVFELVSPNPDDARVRNNDVIHKVAEYHRVGIPQYVLADVVVRPDETRRIELINHIWSPDGYRVQPRDRHRRVRLEVPGIDLRLGTRWENRNHRLAVFDGATGEEIRDYQGMKQLAETEAQRAEAEAQRAADAEARLAAMAERVRELEARLGGG